MNQVKISVIIPVYNDEEFVGEALDSVLNQTLKDVEIICVNDGSTDRSLDILNEYKDNFGDKIKVFSQENQGSGIARNNAMKEATGEYIAFLDSDDLYLDEDALERMYNSAIKNDADMVSANLMILLQSGELITSNNLPRFSEEKIIKPEEYGIPYSYIKNIFRRKFLTDNHFCFPDLLRGQDPVFFAEIQTSLKEIPVVPTELYGVRSSGNNFKKLDVYKKRFDYIKHFKWTIDILRGANFHDLVELYKKQLFFYLNSPELEGKTKEKKENQEIIESIFKDDVEILNECREFFIPKVSLIIPVYNASEFLEESIGSALKQTLQNIELVCVNDGSKDNSLELLRQFANKDSRVKVIDQPNGGCGAARNRALDNARGEYIYFFDPDDYMLPTALEELYNNAVANDSDFVIFKVARFRDGEPINYNSPGFAFERIFKDEDFNNFTFSYKDVKRHVLLSSFAPWTKFYKKSFLDKYPDFRFHTNVAYDDVPFHVQSMLRASRISYLPKFFYHYRLSNPNSVNNTASNAPDILKIITFVEDFLKKEGFYSEFREEFIIFKLTQLSLYIPLSNSQDYFNLAKENILDLDFNSTDVPESILARDSALKYYNAIINANTIEEYLSNLKIQRSNAIEIQKQIDEVHAQNRELQSKIDDLTNQRADLQTKNESEVIVSQNRVLQSKIDDLNNQLEILKMDNELQISLHEKIIEENHKLNLKNSLLNEKIDYLNKKIEYIENKNKKRFKYF